MASEGAVQFVPLETQAEVTVTATSPAWLDVTMVVSEGATQCATPVAQATMPEAG